MVSPIEYYSSRAVYTQIKRHQNKNIDMPIAVNADADASTVLDGGALSEKDAVATTTISEKRGSQDSSSSENDLDTLDSFESIKDFQVKEPIAVLPQYITQIPVTLTATEANLPKLGGNFEVTGPGSEEPLFLIRREKASLHHRQNIIDAASSKPILTLRKLTAHFPESYTFEDPSGTKILEIQGNFFVPYNGAKSTTVFTNAADGQKVLLAMKGSFRNRHAAIKNVSTGDIIATMRSETSNGKAFVGRRVYTIEVAGGVDVTLAVAMITALDARAG